ncbi:MAG TPA: MFS transporter, partial [Vicinamibacteria bacterium]|nr:MFS transporter [Vicinamibacteria bacterium]
LGLRTFAAELPLVAFMLVGGAVADRVDRRRILLTSQVFQMSMACVLGVLYAASQLGIAAILVVAFLTGLAQSQSAPTYQATLTSLVPREHIPNAVALNSLQFNLSRAIGPVVAGLLLAKVGTGACFAANVLSFVGVIVALWRIEMPPATAPGKESLGESLKAGIRHVAGSPVLSVLTALGAAGSFLAFPLITFLPVVAGDVLGTGAAGYSLLLSSLGVGAIAGAVTTAQRGSVSGRGRLMLLAFMSYGIFTVGAVVSGRQWPAMALLAASGFSLVTAFSILNSLVQEHAPNELRGRVLSIFGLAFRGGMPMGSLAAGGLVKDFGAPAVLGAFAGGLFVIAAGIRLRNARLRAL